jgi:4-amino-4-deoxy-L-arabinose transferase-like glycosyltransferase
LIHSSSRRTRLGLLVLVLLYGTALRSFRLGVAPLWTDEAETAINALTILTDGVPTDRYLGQPIYENTFTQPWPGHPEYEFKDSSYSSRGLAIYHGWLPLYTTAFSFWLYGIEPDRAPPATPVRRSLQDLYDRTIAARTPAVFFGIVFLLAIFLTAREAYGRDAGWAAVAAATVSTSAITLARQARYYSATLAITALCALLLTRMVTRGKRRDFAFGGITLALLFHTNLLALVGVVAALASATHLLVRQHRVWTKLALVGGCFATGVLPWVLLTGFLESAARLPPARALLGAEEISSYLQQRWPFVIVAVATVVWLTSIEVFRARMPERLRRPFLHAKPIFIVLAVWTIVASTAFNLLVPAASYFHSRLSLILLVPSLLFGAMLFTALVRVITHHHSPLLASTLFVLLLGSTGKVMLWWPPFQDGTPPLFDVVEHLQAARITPQTRLYGDTGTALQLAFYTGLPVQSVLPIRRTFLDTYPGEVVVIEGPALSRLSGPEVRQQLAAEGVVIGDREAWRLARRVNDHHAGRIARPRCPPVSGARAGGGADHCAEAAPAPEDAPRSGGDDR